MPHNPLKLFSLKGKVIIITGGAGFLGTQYARALTGAGAKVVLWDMKKAPGVELVDITDEPAVQAAVKKIMKK
ncbi:MAG: Short-chain dehydrogenase/reductase SDR [Parcubacteria group bacterium GW2011_GWF1_52_5]|nr:MAG: Short-chain dehydrogenase/reductase SDR [Parcubacteria group bacterium GW2011_GWF1_52_5]